MKKTDPKDALDWPDDSLSEVTGFDAPLAIIKSITACNSAVTAMTVCGDFLLVGFIAPEVHVYHLNSMKHLCTFFSHRAPITALCAFHPADTDLPPCYGHTVAISADADGTIMLWPIPPSDPLHCPAAVDPAMAAPLADAADSAPAECLHVCPADDSAAAAVWAGGLDGRVCVWSAAGRPAVLARFAAHSGAVTAMCAAACMQA
jgi:hypothetical protein